MARLLRLARQSALTGAVAVLGTLAHAQVIFTNATSSFPNASIGYTENVDFGDVDGDGDWDVFLAEITHAWAGPSSDRSSLLEHLGGRPPRFRRHPEAAPRVHEGESWNQGDLYCALADLDGDGALDIVVASGDYPDRQRLRLFRQTAPLVFEDVTDRAGIQLDNCAMISLCDYDRDGDVDILTGTTNTRLPAAQQRTVRPFLYENRLGSRRHWLQVRLRGRGAAAGGSNREGIGAAVTVVLPDGRRLRRQVQGGHGHAGHNAPYEVSFGLGDAPRAARLEVRWPGPADVTSVFEDVAADRVWRVDEGPAGGPARLVSLGPE